MNKRQEKMNQTTKTLHKMINMLWDLSSEYKKDKDEEWFIHFEEFKLKTIHEIFIQRSIFFGEFPKEYLDYCGRYTKTNN